MGSSGGDAAETKQTRARGDTNISGVDILPIPPALEFPYPQKPADRSRSTIAGEKAPHNKPQRPSADRLSSFPFFPPRKTSTAPISRTKSKNQDLATLGSGSPGLLQRVGSAPLRPQGPRQYGTERPRASRTSTFQKATPLYNPEVWGSDYSESSDDEKAASPSRKATESHPESGALQRTSTAPLQRRRSDHYRRFAFGDDGYQTRGHVSKHDGRLNISMRETAHKGYLAKALGSSLEHHLAPALHRRDKRVTTDALSGLEETRCQRDGRPSLHQQPTNQSTASTVSDLSTDDNLPVPKLNIVVMVIGSRGDIQPFLRLGKLLKEEHGHRVRIATHPTFKKFVEEDAKLDFFNVGGDPAELMAFMVKNPGLIPKPETLKSGEIPRRRAQMFEMFQGFWRACINSSDSEPDPGNRKLLESKQPFVADAIIANPPCFAHIHCAERLGIPLHLMFTFPNTPTQQFPHPLTNIRQTNVDANYTNFMSYPLVEMMQWQGLGDLINDFRVKTLGLDPMSMLWAPGQLFRMKVPFSYLWSPGLIPKPLDWGDEIDITGFVFLDLASSFKPPDDLAKFLESGEPPVYIGFGSIVVDDPDKFTQLIFKAVKKAGVRALVNKGWGGLGGEDTPDNIFMLDNTPHDWLFPRVSAVVHHGGAGTTAIGLKCGKPTMIVPFFGDQPFWGAMVAKTGAGPGPVPYKQLSSDKLAEGIKELVTEEKQKHAQELSKKIAAEGDGAQNAVKSFHKHLPRRGPHSFRCSVFQEQVATWSLKGTEIHLSPFAAFLLVKQNRISWKDLRLARVFDWNDFEGPGEPLTGAGASVFSSLIDASAGIGKVPFHWSKIIRRKAERDRHRRKIRSGQLSERPKSGDKEDNKLGKEEQAEQDDQTIEQKQADHRQKVSATLPRGEHAPKRAVSPSTAKQESASRKGGEAGLESLLPGGNEPVDTNKHPSRFHLPHLRKGSGLGRPSDDHTLVDASEDDPDDGESDDLAIQLVEETGRGLGQSGSALAKLPMNFLLALARGLHNAPRLYGDDTVRTTRRINGFHSGVHAAADEFIYGVWDGWSGVIRQPYTGAKYHGPVGCVQGIGKGAGGFALKNLAAIFGLPAYTMKGVHKELTKHRQPTAFIRRSRMVEGHLFYNGLTEAQRKTATQQLADAWEVIEAVNLEIQKTIKNQGIRGRLQVYRHRQWLREHGLLGNVSGLQRALEAKRAGRDWEVEFREEKERHQREQVAALKRRHAEKKHNEGNEKSHQQTPDVRMKTQRGTHHALKKSAKKSDKRWLKSQPESTAGPLVEQEHKDGSGSLDAARPQAHTHIASADDGVTAGDHFVEGSSLDHANSVDPRSPRAPLARKRVNSDNTLVSEAGNTGEA